MLATYEEIYYQMKKEDLFFICALLLFTSCFIFITPLKEWFIFFSSCTDYRSLIMAFLKFAVLATLGEVIGLRIKSGKYSAYGFGLIPRMIVWGFLGIAISVVMTVFASGVPAMLDRLGASLSNSFVVAFFISCFMNLIFAPVFMTLHRVTDTHIANTGGTLRGFFTPIHFGDILANLNWNSLYRFVFKKTIPFFWIPAHTITFLLPQEWRVLFAALLGVVLGVLLSIAMRPKKPL